MKKYDVISVGSGLVDAFVRAEFEERKNNIILPVGTKILVKDITFSPGGGGVNSAMCFAHLGLKTGFLGKMGSGYNSNIILRELGKGNVDFLGIRAEEHTGYSIILESKEKNRTILTFKAASDSLRFDEINLNKLNTKWFYFTSLGGESFDSQKKIAILGRRRGIKVAYNPSSYHTKNGAEYLSDILRNCDFLSLNKEEAAMLVKNGNLFNGLRELGPRIVCITDGKNEGGVYDGEFLYRYWPPKVRVREATGAGDIFGSSFVAGLIKFNNVEKALRIAIAHSAFAISQEDGINRRLLRFNDIEKIIKGQRFKVKKEELE